MPKFKQASKRLHKRTNADYIKLDSGEKVFVGPYTLEQRRQYINAWTSLYMTRYPHAKHKQAQRRAVHQWRNVVQAALDHFAKQKMPGGDNDKK